MLSPYRAEPWVRWWDGCDVGGWLRPREDEVLWVKEGTQSTVGSCFCCLSSQSPKSTPGLAATAHLGVATSTCGTAGQGRGGPGWPPCQRGADPACTDTLGPATGLSWPLARTPQQSPGEQVRGLDAERALGPAAVAGEAPGGHQWEETDPSTASTANARGQRQWGRGTSPGR